MTKATDNEASQEAAGDFQLAHFLPYQLSIASNAVSGLISGRYRARFGIKIPEWRVMTHLGDTGSHAGQLTQRQLTEATLMDKVAVNRACKVLEERGLIARIANESDGRSHLLALTAEGEAIYREVMPMARAIEAELLEGLDEAEAASLREMLAKLRARAGNLAQRSEG